MFQESEFKSLKLCRLHNKTALMRIEWSLSRHVETLIGKYRRFINETSIETSNLLFSLNESEKKSHVFHEKSLKSFVLRKL